MLGRYPFVEPSKCRSRDLGEDQLRQLVATGITAFVCLQVRGVGLVVWGVRRAAGARTGVTACQAAGRAAVWC